MAYQYIFTLVGASSEKEPFGCFDLSAELPGLICSSRDSKHKASSYHEHVSSVE